MQTLTFIFAFVAVLALIFLVGWLARRFAGNRLGANTNRSRMPRLAVIDAAAVDGRRRLVLVRRDNVEHLLMIGGPTDIVVEPNIVRAMPGRDQLPARPAVASPDAQARIAPIPEPGGWADADAARAEPPFEQHSEPQLPEPPPRPARPAFAEDVRRSAPERRAERSDPLLSGFAPEPISGREPSPRIASRSEPLMPRTARTNEVPKPPIRQAPPERPAAAPPPAISSADQNLAEMAQRLEAALRRPAGETVAPPVAPEPPPPRATPRSESAPQPNPAPAKSSFDNLEDEMASLLGRPKTPT